MDIQEFIDRYRSAFGSEACLPLALWYSNDAVAETPKLGGCLFKHLDSLNRGESVSLCVGNIGCGGGKFYCGFTEMPEHVPDFVSRKEHYKASPEMVADMIGSLGVMRAQKSFLNISRIDNLASFDAVEGLLFFVTPDVLSGLVTWAFYDRNDPDTVVSMFGSGCSTAISQVIGENARGGHRSFIGFFDPSARPYVGENILSFAVPMSRFREMYETMPHSSLFGTHAWSRLSERIR